MDRASGVLLHITSLPGDGLGCFSDEAYKFIDFLKSANIKYWQVLPFSHTNYGQSPYSSFSAFAGNPYFIDLTKFLTCQQLKELGFSFKEKDNSRLQESYDKALRFIYENFKNKYSLKSFISRNSYWIKDYAMFMTIKKKYNVDSLVNFPVNLKTREINALELFEKENKNEIEYHIFLQYIFDLQWKRIKRYANKLNIKIIGDMPIYVCLDSSDVWAKSKYFQVDENLIPRQTAGTPPDYFSKTGQMWDNPVYDYDQMSKDNFEWWIKRFKHLQNYFDVLKIDHFRGFASYFTIPQGAVDASSGQWHSAPGKKLFEQINKHCKIDIIAEDLGIITPDVVELLNFTGYPGMKVLQFAFDSDLYNPYLPHNFDKNCVAYIGTHDNDTAMGFLQKCDNEKLNRIKNYYKLDLKSTFEEITNEFIKSLFKSRANLIIITMQDLLKEGSEFRMNIPGTDFGNWTYKLEKNLSFDNLSKKLYSLCQTYQR